MNSAFKNTKKHTIKPLMGALALAVILIANVHPVVYASDLTTSKVLTLTNESRQSSGLPALSLSQDLTVAAEAKAADMLKNNYFSHTSPTGVTPWHWIANTGYNYRYAGENLAINYETAKSTQNAWMKSPTHRANILSKNYTEVGIAIAEGKIDGETARVTIVMFGQPKVVAVPAPAKETPVAAQPAEVRGVSEENTAGVVPDAPQMPLAEEQVAYSTQSQVNYQSLENLALNESMLVWLGILELTLVLSALYFFYKDAMEYVAFEKGVENVLKSEEEQNNNQSVGAEAPSTV
jgi:hypothetical protein